MSYRGVVLVRNPEFSCWRAWGARSCDLVRVATGQACINTHRCDPRQGPRRLCTALNGFFSPKTPGQAGREREGAGGVHTEVAKHSTMSLSILAVTSNAFAMETELIARFRRFVPTFIESHFGKGKHRPIFAV